MKTALEMLKQLEFCLIHPGGMIKDPKTGKLVGKCPVCLGWDASKDGRGETPGRHTKDCELAAILKAGGASGKRFPDAEVKLLRKALRALANDPSPIRRALALAALKARKATRHSFSHGDSKKNEHAKMP